MDFHILLSNRFFFLLDLTDDAEGTLCLRLRQVQAGVLASKGKGAHGNRKQTRVDGSLAAR